ncbi:hypothetical protein [Cytobacillus massiliigabonensis]|uniref:hypothetical protein n=1 Tax=Cytobacillus massiliigabonensis TaxID=1871011 RepID=UPI000C827E2E|nr:hypothetical protein [Cytobacillus massiliigabonensis]
MDESAIKWILVLLFLMILSLLSIYLVLSHRGKRRHLINMLLEAADQIPVHHPEFILKAVENQKELRKIVEMDRESYQDITMEFEKYLALWRRYPDGINILICQNEIIGIFSIWPVKRRIYKKLAEGTITEENVRLGDIPNIKNNGLCSTWYFSTIQIIDTYRHSGIVYDLFRRTIKKWFTSSKVVFPIKICSMAYSDSGEYLLKKTGFVKVRDKEESNSMMSTYQIILNTKDEAIKFVNDVTSSIN